ncbi:MAG: hypothetical protein Q9223_001575, partial [Gallowayella weberi]
MSRIPYTLIAFGISAVSLLAAQKSYIAITNLQKYEERSEKAAKHSETAAHELYKTRVTQGSSAVVFFIFPPQLLHGHNNDSFDQKITTDIVASSSSAASLHTVNHPDIDSRLIKLAHQIGAFIVATGDAYRNLVPQYIGLTIDYIVKNFDEPADEEDTSSKGKQRRTERSASAAAGIARYPFQWATDTPSFRQAIRQFTKDTQQLRTHPSVKQYIRLRDPPSTGNTPEHITPSLSPPPGFTLNNPIEPIPGSNIPLNNLPATTSSSRSRSQSDTQTSNTSVETTVFGNLQGNTQPTFPRLNPPFPRSQSARPQPVVQPTPLVMDEASIQRAVQAALRQAREEWRAEQAQAPSGPPGPQGPPGPRGEPGLDGVGGNGQPRWHANDLGFFDPMYDGKSVSSGSPMEHTGKDTIFRDVHLFIERAKEL